MKTTDLLQFVDVEAVVPSGNNPRTINAKSAEFAELIESIKAQGVVVPVHIRRHPKQKDKFELLAGERRLLAAKKAAREKIPAINHGELSDDQAFEITFAENFAREDLTPLEQGRAVATLLEKYKGDVEAVASKMGKSIKWTRQRQALGTKLSKPWKKALVENEEFKDFTAGHLQQIAALPGSMQAELLDELENGFGDIPTIKELEQQIAEQMQLISKAPFFEDQKSKAACEKCQKRTSCQPGLFYDTPDAETIKRNDRCLDRRCWQEKTISWLTAKFETLKKKHPNLVPIATEYIGPGRPRGEWPGLLSRYEFEQTTKKAKKSVPGFIIYGKALGTILWITANRLGQSAEKKVKSAAGKPTPLAERRKMLTAKRSARFLTKLAEIVKSKTVKDLVAKDKTGTVMALAGVFGVAEPYDDNTWTYQREVVLNPWRTFDKLARSDTAAIRKQLWQKIRPVLIRNLNYEGPITKTPPERLSAGKKLAALFGLDVKAIERDIAKEIPEPKSWAKLSEDGTSKKNAKAKTKKGAKAKRSAKKQPA